MPAAESHDHSIENAIPVCFDCHAEIHAYNPKHPRGRRFTPEELLAHKEQWLNICETKPEIFLEANRNVDIGPLQGLLDELDYNLDISADFNGGTLGFLFRDDQLSRAIREGVLSTIDVSLRQSVSLAYGAISRANERIKSFHQIQLQDGGMAQQKAYGAVQLTIPKVRYARDLLLQFVRSEE